ncbi:MAG: hypothetical protein EA360_06580 [Balneolaceae bacterium]|nr:MAG: hypothetical protein EA360_06580 [Balneolaceae bacterium]
MSSKNVKGSGRKRKRVTGYDFKQPKLFSKEIMRTLRSMHDVLARSLARVLGNALRKKVDVYVQKIEQVSASEFLLGVENPSVIFMMNEEKLTDDLIFVMPTGFCIHMIEKQSGGRGDNISEKRPLTTIEEKIVNRIMGGINKEIVAAWEPYEEFRILGTHYESKPENVHLSSADPMLIIHLKVDMGEKHTILKISYSYSLLKQAMSSSLMKKSSRFMAEKLTDDEKRAYQLTLSAAGMRIQPLLGSCTLTVDEIINLKEGDTISLDQRTDQPLQVHVNGVKKMTGYPGLIRGRRAVKVYEIDEEINEQELI